MVQNSRKRATLRRVGRKNRRRSLKAQPLVKASQWGKQQIFTGKQTLISLFLLFRVRPKPLHAEVKWSWRQARFHGDDLGLGRALKKEEEALPGWLVCLRSVSAPRSSPERLGWSGWLAAGLRPGSWGRCCCFSGLMVEALCKDALRGKSGSVMSSGWASASPPGCLPHKHKDQWLLEEKF